MDLDFSICWEIKTYRNYPYIVFVEISKSRLQFFLASGAKTTARAHDVHQGTIGRSGITFL